MDMPVHQMGKIYLWYIKNNIYYIKNNIYYNVANNRQQLSAPSNVHYHISVNCVRLRCPDFNPLLVQIPPNVKVQLLHVHKLLFHQMFGIAVRFLLKYIHFFGACKNIF